MLSTEPNTVGNVSRALVTAAVNHNANRNISFHNCFSDYF